jgi:hypothetical protein
VVRAPPWQKESDVDKIKEDKRKFSTLSYREDKFFRYHTSQCLSSKKARVESSAKSQHIKWFL